jgi:hypothetical protein
MTSLSKQLRKAAVIGAKLAPGAVTASKVAAHSLTGAQINAAALGQVPIAAHAIDADQLGGESPFAFQSHVSATPGGTFMALHWVRP